MTEEHNRHLESIQEKVVLRMAKKYVNGVREHGGNLWEKEGLIDMAIDEAIDQLVYLYTLKDQIEVK